MSPGTSHWSESEPFRWIDGERTIVFGRGKLAEAPELLGQGYTLLTTPRAAASAPSVVQGAARTHEVPPGRVDEIAAGLRDLIDAELVVALGGGRVVDTAKALAAADPPRRVAAIPTTLSGAEMTAIHRHAGGVPGTTPRVRPAIVINDPDLSASQPPAEQAASAGNALAHALEGPLTPLRNPGARLAAIESVSLLAAALGRQARAAESVTGDRLALGSLLAGYVIDSTGYGLHHVLAQTLVRFAGVGHGPANAIMLPHTAAALTRRFPAELAQLADAAGEGVVAFAERLCRLTGTTRLRGLTDADGSILERCADQASRRRELQMTPPAADRDEILSLYRAAW